MIPDPVAVPGCLCAWDFQEPAGSDRVARGRHPYRLRESDGPVERVADGVAGPYAARFGDGPWLKGVRSECPALDIHGARAQVTLAGWIRRARKPGHDGCQALAGVWNEYGRRQYCLFLNLRIHDSAEQVGAHISGVGGPTPGHPYCMDAAIGATPVPFDAWHHVAITYDGRFARSYLDGRLDARGDRNPYAYDLGIFDGGPQGGNFTVGAVQRPIKPHDDPAVCGTITGNWFVGLLGSLAVWDRCLDDREVSGLAAR